LHLEGPILSKTKKGAHNPEYFQAPNKDTIRAWHRKNGIRMVTLAPELEGALEVTQKLVTRGVTVSAGHSNATYGQAVAGIRAGISMGTHLFNAMSSLGHREPGLVGALLENPDVKAGIIADGIHVHPAAVSMTTKIKGPKNMILVSDAMSALGMPPGEYPQIDEIVYVGENSARLANGSLAGSILTLDKALRNLIAFTGCSVKAAILTITTNPAQTIGESQKGEITAGFDADLVFLNQDLRPVATMVAGKFLWKANNTR
jgi:N-acetylglucosamine-6-phosphate deacetylase